MCVLYLYNNRKDYYWSTTTTIRLLRLRCCCCLPSQIIRINPMTRERAHWLPPPAGSTCLWELWLLGGLYSWTDMSSGVCSDLTQVVRQCFSVLCWFFRFDRRGLSFSTQLSFRLLMALATKSMSLYSVSFVESFTSGRTVGWCFIWSVCFISLRIGSLWWCCCRHALY